MRNENNIPRLKRYFTLGPLILDTVKSDAYLEEADLQVTDREFDVLYLLARQEGRFVPFSELYQAVWELPVGADCRAQAMEEMNLLMEKFNLSGTDIARIEPMQNNSISFCLKMIAKSKHH